jgi:MFS-type transporter involved in bile tolerance (Atg22 family)
MMALREIMIWIVQAVLFGIGIGVAGLTAHLAGPLLAKTFAIHELIPTAVVFIAMAAGLGWLGNRFWPEGTIP